MKIAIASGKGGTGKTLVATNLARVASERMAVVLLDLDVEEPNCHLFFEGGRDEGELVREMVPVVDEDRCAHCGVCGDVCEYNAIVNLPAKVMVFPELCHSCYGCLEMCPERAISEGFKTIGRTFVEHTGSPVLISGLLEIGQPATTAMVAATKKRAQSIPRGAGGRGGDGGGIDEGSRGRGAGRSADGDGSNGAPDAALQIYDSPPGTSCPVVEAVKDADYVVLVGEPTRFGLHDLDLMVQTLKLLAKPFGVVANKAAPGNLDIEDYCEAQGADVILRVPWEREIADDYAEGRLVSETMPEARRLFEALLETLIAKAGEKVDAPGGKPRVEPPPSDGVEAQP